MSKLKTISFCLLAFLLIFGIFTFLKIKHHEEFQQKAVLAKDMRKAVEHLMLDLIEARENTILDAPADGQWHDRIAFSTPRLGPLEYLIKDRHLWRNNEGKNLLIANNIGAFHIRRQKNTPDILEVQIEALSNVSLVSNLKIRIHQ
jgi:hypothetical protein